jgi:hypothetical protein
MQRGSGRRDAPSVCCSYIYRGTFSSSYEALISLNHTRRPPFELLADQGEGMSAKVLCWIFRSHLDVTPILRVSRTRRPPVTSSKYLQVHRVLAKLRGRLWSASSFPCRRFVWYLRYTLHMYCLDIL